MRLPRGSEWRRIEQSFRLEGNDLRLVFFVRPGAGAWVDDLELLDAEGRPVMVRGLSPYHRQFKNWLALYRGEGREYLAYGLQVRPPKLETRQIRRGARTLPAVCHAAYRNARGEEAVALANGTWEDQEVAFAWKGRSWRVDLAPGECRLVK